MPAHADRAFSHIPNGVREVSISRRAAEPEAACPASRPGASLRGAYSTPASATAINGNRANGTGILNNELYIGRQVWGRKTWLKDPSTGRHVARSAAPDARVLTEVPELRIVPDELWQEVKDRQALLDRRDKNTEASRGQDTFWAKQ